MKINLKPSRYPSRTKTDIAQIRKVLDEVLFCTIAYVKHDVAYQLPTGFVRQGDYLIIHGSSKSDFLEGIMQAKQASISTMLFDGLILADTAFDHSVNYRSVVLFSVPEEVTDSEEKKKHLEAFTEKMVPGRMNDLPAITNEELRATRVLKFEIREASLKVRLGSSGSTEGSVWTGTVPARLCYDLPVENDSTKADVKVPDYLTRLVVKSNG